MTGLHGIMSALEMKVGNYLVLSHQCVLSSWLMRTVARPVWTSDKGEARAFWSRQEIPFIVVLFLEKEGN